MQSPAAVPAPPRRLAAFALGAFLLLGLVYPILGPALPRLSEQFGLRATGASLLLSLNSGGAFLGVILSGLLSAWLSPRQRSLIAVSLLGLGCLGLAFAPSFGLALTASLVLGFGFGMLDLTLNTWVAFSYAGRSAAALNLLSAPFGVGAVLAPLAVGLVDGNFRGPLLGCLGLAAALLVVLAVVPQGGAAASQNFQANSPLAPATRLVMGTFILLFLAYVATESGIGAWEVTHLREVLHVGTGTAALLSSLFWASFTLGRLISAPLALRLPPARLVGGALVLASLSLALASVPSLAVIAYTLTGLFLAPVFTTGLVWLTQALPGSSAPTLVFAGSFVGPVLTAPLIGAAHDRFGAGAIPLALLGLALVSLITALALQFQLRRLSVAVQ